MPELLIELFSEEIPARMQQKAADDLRQMVTNALVEAGLTYEGAQAHGGARRLVLSVEGLDAKAADVAEERKGPRVDAPQQAIDGFLKSTGLSLDQLKVQDDKKGQFYLAVIRRPGRAATEIISNVVPDTIRKFPWPKSMRWGSGTLRWVRPLHSIVCTFDGEVVPFEIEGIASGNVTRGHRFMGSQHIEVRRFEDYALKLAREFVIVDATARAETIRTEARNLAFAQGLELIEDEGLLKETAGLVEWPVVLMGSFDESFLTVPPEVIATSIKNHQKCFALRNTMTGQLANRYLHGGEPRGEGRRQDHHRRQQQGDRRTALGCQVLLGPGPQGEAGGLGDEARRDHLPREARQPGRARRPASKHWQAKSPRPSAPMNSRQGARRSSPRPISSPAWSANSPNFKA